ncbi:MAG TPA: thioredoxin family protein [Elusimicrobiales bacterium]|nr:thioredoxin family protein [Elusimicrobiales bacterium]
MAIKDIKMKEGLELELRSGGDKFLLFYSAWCPYCIEFTPAFEKIAASDAGVFSKVCIDELPEVEDLFSIEVVPTVLFFRSGVVDRRLNGIEGVGLTAEGLADFIFLCRGRGRH